MSFSSFFINSNFRLFKMICSMVGRTNSMGAVSFGISTSVIFTKYTPNESCSYLKFEFFRSPGVFAAKGGIAAATDLNFTQVESFKLNDLY